MTWLRSSRQHKQNQAADSRGRVSIAGNKACEDENGRPTSKLAEMGALTVREFKFRMIKLEAKDDFTSDHSFIQ